MLINEINTPVFAQRFLFWFTRSSLFTTQRSYASTVLGVIILSVSLPHACFVTKPNNALQIFWTTQKANTLIFWHQQWLVGDAHSV